MSTQRSADILRYWLATLRHEEALAVRPRARRAESNRTGSSIPNSSAPAAGQDYVKFPFTDNERLLVAQRGSTTLEFNSEVCAFFEDWLFNQYRRSDEDPRLSHLLCFPSVLLPRGQLAGVVRSAASLRWLTASGAEFKPASSGARAKSEPCSPPTALRVTAALSDDGAPFFIDAKLLRDTLKIDTERLDEFFAQLRERPHAPASVLTRVCELLTEQLRADGADVDEASDTVPSTKSSARNAPRDDVPSKRVTPDDETPDDETPDDETPDDETPDDETPDDETPAVDDSPTPDQSECAALLSRLHRRTHERLTQLGSRSRVYDVALLLDASRNRATFHVQRDLQAAQSLIQEGELPAQSPLAAYLGRRKFGGERKPLLGRWRSGGLTDSQRQAAELFLGSKIAAVQGPPGTGKTHVILSLAADEVVRKASPLTDRAHPGTEVLLVCSTNNRAVDNVVHPLGKDQPDDRLALALRVGSREVIEKVTSVDLQRAKRWLETHPALTDADYAARVSRFSKLRAEVDAALAPWTRRQQRKERLQRCRAELASLREAPPSQAQADLRNVMHSLGLELTRTIIESPTKVARALGPLCRRLTELSTMAEAERGTAILRLEQHFKLTQSTALAEAEQTLGSKLSLALPPVSVAEQSVADQREAWEQAAEDALAPLLELQLALQSQADAVSTQLLERDLQAELRTLEDEAREAPTSTDAEFDWQRLEPLLHELFEAATTLREGWALKNKVALVAALQKTIETCKRSRSLRNLLQSSKGPGAWLRRLYPVWGCTLLSLGNVFPPEAEQVERVVVDEAGQCHSAYAASALLRGRSALVIGDVNQLEPVVELSRQDETRVLRGLELRLDAASLEPFRMYEGCHNSAQSVADRVVADRPTLIDHFRCQPEIAAVSETLCGYGLITHTPRRSCVELAAELSHPLLHTPTRGEQQRFAGSWLNEAEIASVVAWTQRLLRAGLSAGDLGIITPFRGQLESLWRSLRAVNVPLERPQLEDEAQASLFSTANAGVALGTVHRFQGGERRVILFSTTITQRQSLRFVDEHVNLVNVAASRAKEHLVTIGHSATLAAGTHTNVLIESATIAHPS